VGLFAAGRVSVALAARLGAMRLSGELDALELRGVSAARFVLTPALAAMLVAAPVLTVGGGAAALLASGLVLRLDAALPWRSYLNLILTPDLAADALSAVLKAALFVALALGAGAAAGSASVRDARDLELRTTQAFNAGILSVFTAAALVAVLAG
jgi:phospholipid/cholesterol/gamma-HCH transport system permease protein